MVTGKPWETSLGVPAAVISTFGALKGLPPPQHRRKPFQTSKGKKAGGKGWKFQFPFFASEVSNGFLRCRGGKPFECSEGANHGGRDPQGGLPGLARHHWKPPWGSLLPVSYTHLTLPTKA